MRSTKAAPKIGEVYLLRFEGSGSEQQGYRPALVVQNNVGNQYSPNVVVLPLTSQLRKISQPTHVFLPANKTGLSRDSIVLCENPKCICKEKLGVYLVTLPEVFMREIAAAYILSTSIISFLPYDKLCSLWERASALNAV